LGNSTKPVLVIIPSLRGGGAERTVPLIFDSISARTHASVTLLILDSGNSLVDISQHKNIRVLYPKLSIPLWKIFTCLSLIKNHEIIAFTMWHTALLGIILRSFGLFTRKLFVVLERNSLANRLNDKTFKGRLYFLVFKKRVRYMDIVISVAGFIIEEYKHHGICLPRGGMVSIPNPVYKHYIDRSLKPEEKSIKLVGVGRFELQKNFEFLIQIVRHLRDKYRMEVYLDIYGGGSLRARYLRLIEKYDLDALVRLHGYTHDIGSRMQNASLIVIPSIYEGFPSVLLDALQTDTPILCSENIKSLNEIEGLGNCLVGIAPLEIFQFGEQILRLTNAGRVSVDQSAARASVLNRFDIGSISSRYWSQIVSVNQ